MTDGKYKKLTHTVIGCAMRVHRELGNGFQEVIYQRALAFAMKDAGLTFMRERETPVFFDGYHVGSRRADFIVDDVVMLEIKAVSALDDTHLNQALNYLKAYQREVGLLINFGTNSLQFKRLANSGLHL